jgi:hypothetical protein
MVSFLSQSTDLQQFINITDEKQTYKVIHQLQSTIQRTDTEVLYLFKETPVANNELSLTHM